MTSRARCYVSCLDGPASVQDTGHHDGLVFCEGIGKDRRKLESLEVVAICDHLGFLLGSEADQKILWKTSKVPL